MGFIRNLYRSIVGRMSLSEADEYNKNLDNFRQETRYNGRIKKASYEENVNLNTALQTAIYEKEGKLVKAAQYREKNKENIRKYEALKKRQEQPIETLKPLNKVIDINFDKTEAKRGIEEYVGTSILDRRFKEDLATYVKSQYWDLEIDKQKQIYLNLFKLYRETYGDEKSEEVEKLENRLKEMAGDARKRREILRRNALEKLAVAA